MRLRIVLWITLTLHIIPAVRVKLKLEIFRVGLVEITKIIFPLLGGIQLIGVVDGVPGFVPQKAHELTLVVRRVSHLLLNTRQSVVCQMKRDPYDGNSIGTTPLIPSASEIVSGTKLEFLIQRDNRVSSNDKVISQTRDVSRAYLSVSQLSSYCNAERILPPAGHSMNEARFAVKAFK